MSEVSKWLAVINNTDETITGDADTIKEVKQFLIDNKIKQKYEGDSRGEEGDFHFSPLYKSVAKSLKGTGESTEKSSAVVNVRMIASNDLSGGVDLSCKLARSEDASGTLVKTGVLFAQHEQAIAAAATICGFSIGYQIANEIYEWLEERHFNWTPYTVNVDGEEKVLLLGKDSSGAIQYYMSQRLIEGLINAFEEWGLWDERPSVEPLVPDIGGGYKYYNFSNRFPNIPNSYVPKCQKLIDEYNLDLRNKYIAVSCNADGTVRMNVFPDNTIKMSYRTNKMNIDTLVEPGEEIIALNTNNKDDYEWYYYGGDLDYDHGTGEMPVLGDLRFDSDKDCYVYDNFGMYYRELVGNGNVIDISTNQLNDIAEDENAVDLRHGTISTLLPNWYDNRIIVSTPNTTQWPKDETEEPSYADLNYTTNFLPVKIPTSAIDDTITQAGAISGPTPNNISEKIIKKTDEVTPYIGIDPYPYPDIPPYITPDLPSDVTGIAGTGLLTLWGLDSSNVNKFGIWLWTTGLNSLKNLLQNPMDAIISFQINYAPLSIRSSNEDVYCGFLQVTDCKGDRINQFDDLDCGFQYIKPYYNNVNDYVATQIQLYLPFIGFVNLNPSEVMNRQVGVKYYIDYLTGTCVAHVIIRYNGQSTEFIAATYSGNCAVQIPLTGSNNADNIRNILQSAISAVGAYSAGNFAGVASSGIALGESLLKTSQIQRGGSVGMNAGSMSIKKPYLVITRQVAYDALNRGHFEGMPQNINVVLGTQSGYTRVKYINLESLPCTEDEKALIMSKLQGGVFI